MAQKILELKAKIAADLQASDDTAERTAKKWVPSLIVVTVQGGGARLMIIM